MEKTNEKTAESQPPRDRPEANAAESRRLKPDVTAVRRERAKALRLKNRNKAMRRTG